MIGENVTTGIGVFHKKQNLDRNRRNEYLED